MNAIMTTLIWLVNIAFTERLFRDDQFILAISFIVLAGFNFMAGWNHQYTGKPQDHGNSQLPYASNTHDGGE